MYTDLGFLVKLLLIDSIAHRHLLNATFCGQKSSLVYIFELLLSNR